MPDEIYAQAVKVAEASGFGSVEEYLSARVRDEVSWNAGDVPDSFFTPEILAAIEEGMADADAGRLHSLDEVKAHFKQKSKEWRRRAS